VRTIAHYQIVEKIGEGGMGIVYKARDTRLERTAALKVLPADKTAEPERKRRFMQEARAASALNHPNIITIYDIGSDDSVDFIAMEFVAGRTLDALISRQGMRPAEVLRTAVQIADALAAAHAAGIIHRDLKPGNIMVTDSGLVKVLDFGLAKLTEKPESGEDAATETLGARTEEGAILGTIAYMSPEQAQGLKLDPRSDIFSFGAVLYEMVTGRRPFRGETKVSTLAAILNREPEPLAEATPRELDRIVQRCLRKDPARRFQTMADLKVALEELKDESDSGKLTARNVPPAARRRWPMMTAAGVAIVALALAGAWWMWGRPAAPTAGLRDLRQLTYDEGTTSHPSLSPDAKLVAYESDRAGPGRFDVWVQQTSGGSAIRLTKGPGSHRHPGFSGDGSKIYFDSTGPPPGIYEIPALGGEPRLVAANGISPVVSPDGRNIAYVGMPSQQLLVVPASGGEPRALARGFTANPAAPVWLPDSRQVAFYGLKTGEPQTIEWWIASISGGTPQLTSLGHWAAENKYTGYVLAWLPGNAVVGWLGKDGNMQIYRFHLSGAAAKWRPVGEPEPLTFGGSNNNATIAAGKMAFHSGTQHGAIWSLRADTNRGRVTGALEKLTAEKADYGFVASTSDGKTLAFSSDRGGGRMDLFLRDVSSGQDRTLDAEDPNTFKQWALIDAKGTEVVYTTYDARILWNAYVIPAQGGAKRKICDHCGPTESLSPDGRQFLSSEQPPAPRVHLVDVASGASALVLQHPHDALSRPRFSPDGKWVVFLETHSAASLDVMLAPFRDTAAVSEQDWITVTPTPGNIEQAFWSPDGGLLYYVISAGGSYSLMARRLGGDRHAVDPPFRVFEFPARIHPQLTGYASGDALTAVPGRFIGAIPELSSNIWITDLPK
jgi:serine/threonine protein kinase/Tol biopolymer transport system component